MGGWRERNANADERPSVRPFAHPFLAARVRSAPTRARARHPAAALPLIGGGAVLAVFARVVPIVLWWYIQ